MTTLTTDFMREKLDYVPEVENKNTLYEDYYNKVCSFIFENNAFRLTPKAIEFWLENGYYENAPYYKCLINDVDDRKNTFKRAMGLQLIYDRSNGRNSMIKGTDGKDDVCRETISALNQLGLIQPIRW